jgi:protein-S-isoprenylcysteine O-methyltransferase Ste14
MPLAEEFENQGTWLFRWRGFLPLVLIPLLLVALRHFRWPLDSFALHEAWEFACLGLSILGLAIRVMTVGYAPAKTSGRNTKRQVAAQLNTTGMYSIVRHPLYLGNFLIGFGVVLVQMVWWLPVLYILLFWLYYERIMFAEEAFFSSAICREYKEWAFAVAEARITILESKHNST